MMHMAFPTFLPTPLGTEGYYVVKWPMRGAKLGIRPLGDGAIKLPAVISYNYNDAEETNRSINVSGTE